MKLRLLQVMLAPGDGGAETFFEKLAIAFQASGVQQKLVICRHKARRARLEAAGCEVIEIPAQGWRKWLAAGAVRRIAMEFKPTVQLAWMSRAAAALSRLPDCVNVARLGGYYPLKNFQKCDHLVGNTPGVLDYLARNGWPQNQMSLISNFGEIFDSKDSVARDFRTELGLLEDDSIIVTLGRLHPNKAQDILIQALADIPKATLLIAGGGELRLTLEQLARECGVSNRVHFLGWCRDASSLFEAADLCVFPSRAEPLGNVVLEAWAMGVPIVAAASEGPSWLIDDEVNGLLFPVDDVTACASAANRLLGDDALRMRCVENGCAKWRAEFSKNAILGAYQQLFASLIQSLDG
jgi:glycosyltransferase involved in cell wall biosynthesis